MRKATIGCACVIALSGGCTLAQSAPESTESAESYFHGAVDTCDHPEIGRLSNGCTFTLVAADVGLTAAHCVDSLPEFPTGFRAVGNDGCPGSWSREVERVFIVSGWPGGYGYDVALVFLADPVEAWQALPRQLELGWPALGARTDVYGYGATDCPPWLPWAPDEGTNFGVKRTIQYAWGVEQLAEKPCGGDSGGPHLVDERVAGVTTGAKGWTLLLGFPQSSQLELRDAMSCVQWAQASGGALDPDCP